MSRDMKNAIVGFAYAAIVVSALLYTAWYLASTADQLRIQIDQERRARLSLESSVEIMVRRQKFDEGRIDQLNETVFGKRNDRVITGTKGAKK